MVDVDMEVDIPVYDPTNRNNELDKILDLTDYVFGKFATDEQKKAFNVDKIIDMDMSSAISGVVSTIYTSLRKKKNSNVANAGRIYLSETASVGTATFTLEALINEYTKKEGYIEFDFKTGTALMNMMTSFKLSYDEVRMSVSKFKVREGNRTVDKQITDYGLNNSHIVCLKGITYKPERRSGTISTLGPLALCILLIHEQKYTNKIEAALRSSLKLVPMVNQIITLLKAAKKPSDVGQLLKVLGDYLLIIGDRSQARIHFPLMFLLGLKKIKVDWREFNFSGVAAMKLWNKYSATFYWNKKTGGTSEDLAQIVFHSIFETSFEDLGVLKQITNVAVWKVRSDLSSVFKKSAGASNKSFTPVKFKKISKLANANMTKLVGTVQPMLINRIVFAGKRKRCFTAKFKQYLESGDAAQSYAGDLQSIIYSLQLLKTKAIKEGANIGGNEAGTQNWLELSTIGQWVDSATEVEETGEYFYS